MLFKCVIGNLNYIPFLVQETSRKEVMKVLDKYFKREDWYFTQGSEGMVTKPCEDFPWYNEIKVIDGVVL